MRDRRDAATTFLDVVGLLVLAGGIVLGLWPIVGGWSLIAGGSVIMAVSAWWGRLAARDGDDA